MNAARFQQVEEIFHATLPIDPSRRGPVLDTTCRDDTELRNLVEELLEADAEGTDPTDPDEVRLQLEAILANTDEPDDAPSRGLPERIGGYRIIRCIAVGGMATVYEAEQESPRRRVALKTLHRGAVSKRILRRFQEEVEVLGRMQHPGIARIIEAGTCDLGDGERPFFAMDYVDGPNVIQYAERHQLGTADRLALFLQVCDAVGSAHEAGIIHRDLKPQNILIDDAAPTRRDESIPLGDRPALGQPIVLDFGVARAINPELSIAEARTDVGQLVGTLAYMSPEQLAGDTEVVGVRSDVYALGVLLFELLSGQLPHDVTGCSMADAIELVRERPPHRLGAVDACFHGDLDTIVAKTLTESAHRYLTVFALADDIRRHLRHEPIRARAVSTRYRIGKFVRRNPRVVGIAAVLAVVLAVGAVLAVRSATETSELRRAIEDAGHAPAHWVFRTDGTAVTALVRAGAIALVAVESGVTLGSFGAGTHPELPTLSPDGRWLAALSYDDDGAAVRVWDTVRSAPGWRVPIPPALTPVRVRLSRDAKLVALVSPGEIQVIEADTGAIRCSHISDPGLCRDVVFDASGERFIVREDDVVVFYDLRTGVEFSRAEVSR